MSQPLVRWCRDSQKEQYAPHKKVVDFFSLFNILKKVNARAVKPFRIGSCVNPGKNGQEG
jgi:hypothetical protein